MTAVFDQYIAGVAGLRARRPLPQDEEAAACAALDALWSQLTEDEKDDADYRLRPMDETRIEECDLIGEDVVFDVPYCQVALSFAGQYGGYYSRGPRIKLLMGPLSPQLRESIEKSCRRCKDVRRVVMTKGVVDHYGYVQYTDRDTLDRALFDLTPEELHK